MNYVFLQEYLKPYNCVQIISIRLEYLKSYNCFNEIWETNE